VILWRRLFQILIISAFEVRFLTIGESASGRMLVVAHSESGENIRIISARQVTRREREFYEEAR